MNAVDAILIPLKQLRASQNRLWNMSDDRENAICSCICIYNISEKKNSNAVSNLHRLCIASTSCYRSYIATKKLKKYKKSNIKTFDGKQRASLWENRLFATAQLISAFVFAIRIVQFLLYINQNCQPLAIFCGCTARFVSDLVGNPEDRFSHNEAQIPVVYFFNDMRAQQFTISHFDHYGKFSVWTP